MKTKILALIIVVLCTVSAIQADNSALGEVLVSRNLPVSQYTASEIAEPPWEYAPPLNAFDGDAGTSWNAGNYAPQWIEVDLGVTQNITRIVLTVDQSPDGNTVHKVLVSDAPIQNNSQNAAVACAFSGYTVKGQKLTAILENTVSVRYVQVLTQSSPSWVAWAEIQVYAVNNAYAAGKLSDPQGVAVNSAGHVLVTDRNNIKEYTGDGKFLKQFGGGHGTGNGQFSEAEWLTTDKKDNVYVIDTLGNARIQKFDSSGAFVSTFGWGVLSGSSEFEICKAPSACRKGIEGSGNGQFIVPNAAVVDDSGNVYVSDYIGRSVQKFTRNGNYISKFGSFHGARGITRDRSANIYVVDGDNFRIQKFSGNGDFITQWGSHGSGNGQLDYPVGIVVDSSNNVYVSECGNQRIQKFTGDGVYLTQWGSHGSGNGQFDCAWGMALDNSGNILAVDRHNKRVQKFDPSGKYLSQLGQPNAVSLNIKTGDMNQPAPHSFTGNAEWSKPVNGLRARLQVLPSPDATNPFCIVFIEFENTRDVMGQMKIPFTPDKLKLHVTSAGGKELPLNIPLDYDGWQPIWEPILLPLNGTIRFRVSFSGSVYNPKTDKVIVDVGSSKTWVIPQDGQAYYLSGRFSVESSGNRRDWSGMLELPKVEIPQQK